jgi:hypothetical protein
MVLVLSRLQNTLSTIDEERRKIPHYIFLDGEQGLKKIYHEPVAILRADVFGRSRVKIWRQKFRNGDLSCQDAPNTGRPILTLESQLAVFLQKYHFTSA